MRAGDDASDAPAAAEGGSPPPLLEILVPDLGGPAPETLRSADGRVIGVDLPVASADGRSMRDGGPRPVDGAGVPSA